MPTSDVAGTTVAPLVASNLTGHQVALARPDPLFHNRVTRFIDYTRWYWFSAIAIAFLLCFNGQWRIGRDSALYRGLAHNLATGKGYVWGDMAGELIYPGLPLSLAGIERVFGRGDLAPLIFMYLLVPITLVLVYKLIRLHYPRWLATTVTVLVGLNGRYVGLHNDLMTDIPFMAGLMLALYGWERLRIGVGAIEAPAVKDPNPARDDIDRGARWAELRGNGARAISAILLVVGFVWAASMRPMIWPVAAAWGAACVWRLVRGPARRFYLLTSIALLAIAIVLIALDPRTRGFRPTAGVYEAEALRALQHAGLMIFANLRDLLGRNMLAAVTGDRYFIGFNHLLSAIFILAPLLLLRKHLLWGLIVYATFAVTLVLSTVPRYYTPILPFILLAWLLLAVRVARYVARKRDSGAGELVLGFAILLVLVTNFGRLGREVADQRWDDIGNREKFSEELEMAERLRESVPEGSRIIGPDGSPVISYFSGRNVVNSRAIIPPEKHPKHWPRHIAALEVDYAIFPSTLYKEGESHIGDLMDKGVIVPGRVLSRVNPREDDPPMVLCEVTIKVPPQSVDWRKRKSTRAASTEIIQQTSPAERAEREERERKRAAAERRERQERAEAKERKAHAAYKAAKAEKLARMERHAAKERKARKEAKERKERSEAEAREASNAATSAPATESSAVSTPARQSE